MCKNQFLSRLSISQKTVYNVHNNKNPISLTPPGEQRGKQSYSKIPNEKKEFACYIDSYPTVQYVRVCLDRNKIAVEEHNMF